MRQCLCLWGVDVGRGGWIVVSGEDDRVTLPERTLSEYEEIFWSPFDSIEQVLSTQQFPQVSTGRRSCSDSAERAERAFGFNKVRR